MLKNILYLLLGAIITILIFSGLFASITRPHKTQPVSIPQTEKSAN